MSIRLGSIILILAILLLPTGCTSNNESDIPAHFTTYTDEHGVFSISYPNDWTLVTGEPPNMPDIDLKENRDEVTKAIESNLPLSSTLWLLMAYQEGVRAAMSVYAWKIDDPSLSLNQWVDQQIAGDSYEGQTYRVLSRANVTVDGREAVLVEDLRTYSSASFAIVNRHSLWLVTRVDNIDWFVRCGVHPDNYDEFKADIRAVVMSLRILMEEEAVVMVEEELDADFTAEPTRGATPFLIRFTNTSTGDINQFNWDFGDGESSTLENPAHEYVKSNVYGCTVTLTVNGPSGSDTMTKENYIHVSDPFTEFVIKASRTAPWDFPKTLRIGEEASTIVYIRNGEGRSMSYTLRVMLDSVELATTGPITLDYYEEWEDEIRFVPKNVESGQMGKIEFLLYRDAEVEPYYELHIWVEFES